MDGGRYGEALFVAMAAIRAGVTEADEQAEIARALGDAELEVRQVRALALMAALHRVREEFAS